MARRRRQPSQEEEEENAAAASLGLPTHLFESILARIPLKSLLRSKSVCKFWNSTISNPQFINLQSQTLIPSSSSSSSSTRFLICDRNRCAPHKSGGFLLLNFQGHTFHHDSDLGSPFGSADILCYCKGIVLLRCMSQHPEMHVLWNPCRRMYSAIWWSGDRPAAHGLCYDPNSDDYKVVIITRSNNYFVFSCKERNWTKRRIACPEFKSIRNVGVYVEGAFYWLCCQANGGAPQGWSELVCFDGAQEKCDKIQLPADAVRRFLSDAVLTNMKSCLGLIYVSPSDPGIIQIWKMERHRDASSWRPMVGIATYVNMSVSTREPCPISGSDLVVIFMDHHQSRFLVYDVEQERPVGNIQVFPIWSWRIVPCQEHLFFPVQQHIRPKRKKSSNKISYSVFASCN